MKKLFFVAGEVSGDRLAAWYVRFLKRHGREFDIEAIGGDALKAENVRLYERLETLNVTGIVEVVRHIPKLLRLMRNLCDHIVHNAVDEVIVVDFPGFNLRLIQRLKQYAPNIKITYLSPPQLWCWGAWRLATLEKYCDKIVVLYPFEVAWYAERGVLVEWIGSPVQEMLQPYRQEQHKKTPTIAILPGSRPSEVTTLLPIFLRAARIILHKYPTVRFVIPQAPSISGSMIDELIKKHALDDVWASVDVINDGDNRYNQLARCCAALSKPGTVTLELALLEVPTVVGYKTSWLTYQIAKRLVTVAYMGLPNLLTGGGAGPECIQDDCTPEVLAAKLDEIYNAFSNGDGLYQKMIERTQRVAQELTKEER